ncbi:nucleoside diphosphate kinase 7 [Rhipicephalus sanguineus]|uniref:nucleoside diphosphate kinase 7 n=1 Tax=Rhipicephalus sanguineus TaxID=34632 RepID=UPI0020C4C397|nr:nucleoside diphosphate kinase 7 [Rhipicephalus sanguineus]
MMRAPTPSEASSSTFSPETRQWKCTVLVLRPANLRRLGDVWAAVEAAGATVCKSVMLQLTPHDVKLLSANPQEAFDEGLLSGPVVCIQVLGERVLTRLRNQPVKTASEGLSQQAGTLQSLCWISKDKPSAEKESAVLFGTQFERRCNTAVFENTTCCVAKPHVFRDGNVSSVLRKILTSGFEVTALQMFHLDCAKAEEFLLVYKGVATNYTTMVQQLCSGPCLAMEVRSSSNPENSALHFKELVGPADPVLARRLYPDSLRAQVGRDAHRNGVHCTDVPEDARIEVEFFFHAGKT